MPFPSVSLVQLRDHLRLKNASRLPLLTVSMCYPHRSTRDNPSSPTAHSLVEKMETVHSSAQKGDPAALKKVHAAFGNTPDMTAIGTNIKTLKDGKFRMDDAQHPTHIGPGYYDPNTKLVQLGSGFHVGTTPEQRAGTILHEASHSVLGTSDIFNKDGKPTSQARIQNPGDKSGCTFSLLRRAQDLHSFSFQTKTVTCRRC
jgi:hypothetical protein